MKGKYSPSFTSFVSILTNILCSELSALINSILWHFCSFVQWSTQLVLENSKKRIALFAVKCLNEIQDDNITKDAANMLDITENGFLDLKMLDISPVDCKGLFDFLVHVRQLKKLDISQNKITDHAVLELCKFLRNSILGKLDISHNYITDKGLEMLGDALSEETCRLHYLEIGWCYKATSNGYNKLYYTLKKAGFDRTTMALTGSGNIVQYTMQKPLPYADNCYNTKF